MDISSDELTARMADGGVLVRSGREYGPSGEGHFCISFATDLDSLEEDCVESRPFSSTSSADLLTLQRERSGPSREGSAVRGIRRSAERD
jgi:hypothetical protein